DGNVVYLQSKDKKAVYVYVLSDNKNAVEFPSFIQLPDISLTKKCKITFMDNPSIKIKWETTGGANRLMIPASLQGSSNYQYAATFKIELN
ncbi:MAG TPA: hypothetical protein VGG71_13665, partial [Chitinophagaceae bacterium]